MEIVTTLKRSESEIVKEALSNLQHSHIEHYESAGAEFTHTALQIPALRGGAGSGIF